MTVTHKAESKQEGRPEEGVEMRLAQLEGKDDITSLKEQTAQFWVAIQSPPQQTASRNPQLLVNGRKEVETKTIHGTMATVRVVTKNVNAVG